jgi:hypothetical protein
MQMQKMGGILKAQAHRACVIYDSVSGRILHVHHDIALPGGRLVSESEAEEAATAQLRKRGRHSAQLQVLHVSPDELQPRVRYKVDPQRRVLVPLAGK